MYTCGCESSICLLVDVRVLCVIPVGVVVLDLITVGVRVLSMVPQHLDLGR